MVVLAVEVTLGVVFRAIGHSLIWYDEVASVLLAWLTFYGVGARLGQARAHRLSGTASTQRRRRARRALNIVAQVLVIAFFALLGWVGASILPILASDTLVSVPWIPMSVVQSVIPISCALIVVAEVLHLVDLLRRPGRRRRARACRRSPTACTEGAADDACCCCSPRCSRWC